MSTLLEMSTEDKISRTHQKPACDFYPMLYMCFIAAKRGRGAGVLQAILTQATAFRFMSNSGKRVVFEKHWTVLLLACAGLVPARVPKTHTK